MTFSYTFAYEGEYTLYRKPVTPGSTPSTTPSWGADAVEGGDQANGGVPFTDIPDGQYNWVYEQLGEDPAEDDNLLGEIPTPVSNLSSESVSAIVSGLYSSLSGIAPTVQLSYDPVTMQIRLTDGDDWKDGVRTIDIPITLPAGVSVEDCTATFGAVKGTDRIDRIAEVVTIEDIPNVRLTFDRADTLNKPAGRYSWDAEVQYTDTESVVSSITTLEGVLILRKGIAKLPADIT